MFKIITLKNEQGEVKNANRGLSWTSLFFGPLVPLYRGDRKWFYRSFVGFFLTIGLSNILFMFKYNEWYLKDLLENGYEELLGQPLNISDDLKVSRGVRKESNPTSYNNSTLLKPEDIESILLAAEDLEKRLQKDVSKVNRSNDKKRGTNVEVFPKSIDNDKRMVRNTIEYPKIDYSVSKVLGVPKSKHSSNKKVSKPLGIPKLTNELSMSQEDYVIEHSERYKRIYRVIDFSNSRAMDYKEHIVIIHPFNSKQMYDNESNWSSAIHGYIIKNKTNLKDTLNSIVNNIGVKLLIKKEVENLGEIPSLNGYGKVERQMISDKLGSINVKTDFSIEFEFSYTSPKGQSHYLTREVLSFRELEEEMRYVKEIKEERSEFELFRDAERAKVTPGVRYDIMKRDNFACQICGATSDHGVTLHIDHIVPVAKWGKSEESNLQTLCKDCNLGKGTKEF